MTEQDTLDPQAQIDELVSQVDELQGAVRFLRQVNTACRDKLSVWINSRVAGLPTEAYQQVREVRNAMADALSRTKSVS